MAVTDGGPVPAATDATLQPFLQPDFDPATYLNTTLPTLTTATNLNRQQSHTANVVTLSAETQSLLTQLSAQTSRLSTSLTQMTDEIIRSGGRLAYEVELLRGEAIGLTDALESGLKDDLEVFKSAKDSNTGVVLADEQLGEPSTTTNGAQSDTRGYLDRLHILSTVRERLDAVVKIFDEAMHWPVAPSEVTATSNSIISIAAPTSDEAVRAQELKAQQFNKQIEAEVNDMSSVDIADDTASALTRRDQLKRIAPVWHGTTEEKARTKVLNELQDLIDEKLKTIGKDANKASNMPHRAVDYRYGALDTKTFSEGSYNFLHTLRPGKD